MTSLLRPEDLRKISDDQDMAKAKKAMEHARKDEEEQASVHAEAGGDREAEAQRLTKALDELTKKQNSILQQAADPSTHLPEEAARAAVLSLTSAATGPRPPHVRGRAHLGKKGGKKS